MELRGGVGGDLGLSSDATLVPAAESSYLPRQVWASSVAEAEVVSPS